jgi:iron complex transport system permease protein
MTIAASLGLGYSSVSFNRILPTILGEGTFKEEFVLFSIRLPRIAITLLAGMALAISGAILQGLTRNDLADPGIIGINSGAGLGVAVFFLFFPLDASSFAFMLPAVAFLGALITAILIYLFSYKRGMGLQPVRLILVGIGFSMALSGAMVVLISSAERQKVDFIAKWLAGNVWGADWPYVWAILPWLIVLIPFTLYKANKLNLLSLNDPVAIGVGMSLEKERLVLMLTAVALAAAAVSVTGGIAFIGLMAPHLAKALIGPRNQLFLPIALLIGGWLLLFADTIGRNLLEPEGIPAGIMTALIGAPYFIYLLLRK